MVLALEAGGDGESAGAAGDVEEPAAGSAVEVVVVALAAEFVARGLAGQLDGDQPAALDERLEMAVDRCQAQARDAVVRIVEDLLRAERPVGCEERIPDRGLLAGLAGLGRDWRAESRDQRSEIRDQRSERREQEEGVMEVMEVMEGRG